MPPFSPASLAVAATVAAVAAAATSPAPPLDPSDPSTFYRPGEDRGSFDLIMRPYPIPVQTTTYEDFVFNLPASLPDVFHVVMGEVVNSQPSHLHHFVVTGCPEPIDPAREGLPAGRDARGCNLPLGGWAPGSDIFGNVDRDAGVAMGRGLGVAAVRLNVHYTDGAYTNATSLTPKLATDGIRVHFTTSFRPHTSVSKPLISVGFAPRELAVPPGEARFYVTRSCRVAAGCRDRSDDQLATFARLAGRGGGGGAAAALAAAVAGGTLSCGAVAALCGAGGNLETFAQTLCPAACGLCDAAAEGADADGARPLVPAEYRLTAVNYHAHLLGREMYTTLVREDGGGGDAGGDGTAATRGGVGPPPLPTVADLESRELWLYDFQETIPLPAAVAAADAAATAADGSAPPQQRGTVVRPGDRIQATCVYDSTRRDEATLFGLSTYNEMCINSALVTFATPASLLRGDGDGDGGAAGKLDPYAELRLRSFDCDDGAGGDVHAGSLVADEDARDIWRDHPVAEARGCTFPVSPIGLGLFATRNCPADDGDGDGGDAGDDNRGPEAAAANDGAGNDGAETATEADITGQGDSGIDPEAVAETPNPEEKEPAVMGGADASSAAVAARRSFPAALLAAAALVAC